MIVKGVKTLFSEENEWEYCNWMNFEQTFHNFIANSEIQLNLMVLQQLQIEYFKANCRDRDISSRKHFTKSEMR